MNGIASRRDGGVLHVVLDRPEKLNALTRDMADELIAAAGAEVRYLPPYSPDLNPIEMMWSKVKAYLRQAKARNDPDLLAAIAEALRLVSPSDAQGFFRHCGYLCTIC